MRSNGRGRTTLYYRILPGIGRLVFYHMGLLLKAHVIENVKRYFVTTIFGKEKGIGVEKPLSPPWTGERQAGRWVLRSGRLGSDSDVYHMGNVLL